MKKTPWRVAACIMGWLAVNASADQPTVLSDKAKASLSKIALKISGVVETQKPHGFLIKSSDGAELFLLTAAPLKENSLIANVVVYPLGEYSYPTDDTGDVATVKKYTDDSGLAADHVLAIAVEHLPPAASTNSSGFPQLPTSANSPQEGSPAATARGVMGTPPGQSAASLATEFGRYKAKVYRAIGSRWYPKLDKLIEVMPVGAVHIQFTIHSDGSIDARVLEGNQTTLQILLAISLDSIREAAPFDPFTDTLKKEIAAKEGNDGESYTDDLTFTISR